MKVIESLILFPACLIDCIKDLYNNIVLHNISHWKKIWLTVHILHIFLFVFHDAAAAVFFAIYRLICVIFSVFRIIPTRFTALPTITQLIYLINQLVIFSIAVESVKSGKAQQPLSDILGLWFASWSSQSPLMAAFESLVIQHRKFAVVRSAVVV